MVADFWKIVRGWFRYEPQQVVFKPVKMKLCECKECAFYTRRMAVVPNEKYGTMYVLRGYCTKWGTTLHGHKAFFSTFKKTKNEDICK